MGGIDNDGNLFNDIWSSTDGITWTLENGNVPFAARFNHTLVNYNNRLWINGGQDNDFEFNDVWSSSDGVNWVLETDNADFPSRQGHTSLVFNDRIYIIGGIDSNQGSGLGPLNDVWSSTDGINWDVETVDADFSPRFGHTSIVLNNEIWVIGGLGPGRRNDVWSSTDGVNWTLEIEDTLMPSIFSRRFAHTSLTLDDSILIIGGNDGTNRNDVWSLD